MNIQLGNTYKDGMGIAHTINNQWLCSDGTIRYVSGFDPFNAFWYNEHGAFISALTYEEQRVMVSPILNLVPIESK